MPTRPHVFTGISRRAFERMKNDLRALGVKVPEGDSCTIRYKGVAGSIAYSESRRRVEVHIIRKPLFVSGGAVSSMLKRVMRRYSSDEAGSSDKA